MLQDTIDIANTAGTRQVNLIPPGVKGMTQ
eukprot:SAG31_NODE_45904_length_256_cov_3.974522_1_plen_29_part_10